MTYKKFIEHIRGTIQGKLGGSYTVALHKVTKNNGIILDGLTITKEETDISPTIYLNQYYQQYENGLELKAIIQEVYEIYKSSYSCLPTIIENLQNFQAIKAKIAYKLIRQNGNEALLSDVPHTCFLDLAMVYYLLIQSDENGQTTALIHDGHLKIWETTREELHELAVENTQKLLPADIRPIREVINEMETLNLCLGLDEDALELKNPLFVLSNTGNLNGAVCMLYESVLDRFCREHNAEAAYILPSSTHEVLLMPIIAGFNFELEELKEMVREINPTVPQEDVLSDSIYLYRTEDREIRIAI